MEDTFNQLTNYGDTYVPEIHDPQVAELAARELVSLLKKQMPFILK